MLKQEKRPKGLSLTKYFLNSPSRYLSENNTFILKTTVTETVPCSEAEGYGGTKELLVGATHFLLSTTVRLQRDETTRVAQL